jgi:hypothetical protein
MPTEPISRLHGVSISEKTDKLSDFIAGDLDSRTAHGLHAAAGCYLLVARSIDSPVARALIGHAGRLSVASIRVKAIFTEIESGALFPAPFAAPSECRWARDPRLLAAHEQLVLGPAYVWVGDCMRRDPGKRDALERFAASCAETANLAARSFERLWKAASPLESVPSMPAAVANHVCELTGATEARLELLRRQ